MNNKLIFLNSVDLFNLAGVIFVALDNKGKVLAINKKGCETLEYSEKEILGKDWFSNFLPKDENKKVKKVYNELMKGKKSKFEFFENKIITKSGKEKIISWYNTVLKDEKDKIIGTLSSGQDITELREKEKNYIEHIEKIQTINKYNELRTKIWQLAADRSLNFETIIDKAIQIIGPVIGVSRVNYNEIKGKNLVCTKEWKEKNVKNTLGTKIDLKIAKIFMKPDGFEITYDIALKYIPKPLQAIAKPIIKKFAEVNDLKAIFLIPIYSENEFNSAISCDICNSNKKKERFDEMDKQILLDLRNILQSRIAYDKIENTVKESEEKFKMLFENAPDAYYINDLKGNFIDGNKKAEEITGYKKEELIGKSFLDLKLLDFKYIAKATTLLLENAKGKETGPDEIIINRKDGDKIAVEIITKPIKFKNQNLVLGLARDVTEKNKYINEIRKLHIAIEQSPDSIVITDINGNIEYVNPRFTEITGYTMQEAIGKNPRILKSGKTSKEEYKKLWQIILSGNIWRGEFCNKKKNGELYWESAAIAPIKDKYGKIINFIAIKQDITETKKIRDEIEKSRMLLQDFLDNANDLIQIVGPDAKFIYVNKAWKETLGYSYQEIKKMTVFDVIHPSRIEHCKEMFQKVLKGECNDKIETIFITKDKKEIIVEGNVSCHFEDGKPINTRAIFRDITARKKAEENLKLSYEKLKEIDIIKTNFISMVSHDLRTPLTAINGFLSLMLGGAAGELTSQQKEYLEIIKNNSERLLNLINDLLDMNRIETGRFTIEKHTGDIGRVIDKVIKELTSFAAQKNIKIINESTGQKIFCDIDENRIAQVIINLITNSIKFSPENTNIILGFKEINGGDIKIPESMQMPQSKKNRYILIYEKDSGRGIEKEHLEKIFEKFYQIKQTDSTRQKGLGLGLPISKSIIEAHNGIIWAESEGIGKGTTFKILLPL
ncbi:MAG: PAS domain S-box protein [Candidatus Goldbacteria bacterium]|nr:PAS domain S-box protein [Candidatus Goldiibacteriota bacterium]